jgi:hypothetical protein
MNLWLVFVGGRRIVTLFENMFKYVTGLAGLRIRRHRDEVTESSIFMLLTQTIKFFTRNGGEVEGSRGVVEEQGNIGNTRVPNVALCNICFQ